MYSEINNRTFFKVSDAFQTDIEKSQVTQNDPVEHTPASSFFDTKDQALFSTNNKNSTEIIDLFNEPNEIPDKQKTILIVPGFNEGDKLHVNGPAWFDGDAVLKIFNGDLLQVNIKTKAPGILEEKVGYEIVDGMINIDIKIEKDTTDTYKVTTIDNNSNNSERIQSNLKIEYGKTSDKNPSRQKDAIRVRDGRYITTFTINKPGDVSIKTANKLPIIIDLIKK